MKGDGRAEDGAADWPAQGSGLAGREGFFPPVWIGSTDSGKHSSTQPNRKTSKYQIAWKKKVTHIHPYSVLRGPWKQQGYF